MRFPGSPGRAPEEPLDPLDLQAVLTHERFAFRARENAGSCANGAYATCAQSAGNTQTVLGAAVVQQAIDKAGVKGVAPAAAVYERHGVDAGAQSYRVRHQQGASLSHRDDDSPRPEPPKRFGLA